MLSALFNERAVSSVPWSVQNDIGWGVWPGDSVVTAAGVTVDERSAASLLAVYGSASFISDEISTLPVTVDGAARPAWVDEPTQGLDRIAWLGQIMWSLLLSGNAYLAVVGDTMAPMALDPLDPLKVRVERRAGAVRYLVAGQPSRFPIVHIPGRMRPGDLVGMSPVEWARQSIGLGLAAQKYGMDWFDGEGNMPGVIWCRWGYSRRRCGRWPSSGVASGAPAARVCPAFCKVVRRGSRPGSRTSRHSSFRLAAIRLPRSPGRCFCSTHPIWVSRSRARH